MNIQEKLINIRKGNKLTQEQFAEKLYVSRQTVSNWENGKFYPDIETLILISNLFNISLDELLKSDTKVVKDMDKKLKQHKKLIFTIILLIIILISSSFYGYRYYKNHKSIEKNITLKNIPEGYIMTSILDIKIGINHNSDLSTLVNKYIDIYIDNEDYYNKTAEPIIKKAKVFNYSQRSIALIVSEEDYAELQRYNIDEDVYYMIELSE